MSDNQDTFVTPLVAASPPKKPDSLPPGALELPERFADQGRLAAGATGVVHRVFDRRMGRPVAMKILHPHLVQHPGIRARFQREARITARLQHPGIVAVHDRGDLHDGRLWFTMKEIRGLTLDTIIRELHAVSGAGWEVSPGGWSLRRLIEGFRQLCLAVAYAHSQGVVHRDIKPANLMVGEFGEVLVMDWGLAWIPEQGVGEPIGSAGETGRTVLKTSTGAVLGTPAYMSPEQARGTLHASGAQTDVYALGAVLFHILTGQAPYIGPVAAVLDILRSDPPPPTLGPGLPVAPEPLAAIVAQAMAAAPAERFSDAGALAEALRRWLDGDARRQRAREHLSQAVALLPDITRHRGQHGALLARAEEILDRCQPHDPVDRKAPGWALADQARALQIEAAVLEARRLEHLHAALAQTPDDPQIHQHIADHHMVRLADARSPEDAARAEQLVRAHDRGRHAAFLRGESTLLLRTAPPAAQVTVTAERYVERDRRLVLVSAQRWAGSSQERALPAGSYRLTVTADGHHPMHLPVYLERGQRWTTAAPIPLLPLGSLHRADRYVPAGDFLSGGDPDAPDVLPRRRLTVGGFVMQAHPVTHRDYLRFIQALLDAGRAEEAAARMPLSRDTVHDAEAQPVYAPDSAGRLVLLTDTEGIQLRPDHPVTRVSWHDACAFAAWWSQQTGLPWRLPHDQEWEKAARGVDGRRLPWGDHFDPTWARCLQSSSSVPAIAPISGSPEDISPYGIFGMAGNVRDWCHNSYRRRGDPGEEVVPEALPEGDFRMLRGGSWRSMPNLCRLAGRFAERPDRRLGVLGFRLVYSVPPMD